MEIKDCEVEDRLNFVRKVYGILTTQLLLTTLWAALVWNNSSLKNFVYDEYWLVWVFLGLAIGVEMTLICYRRVARKVPLNYFLLGVFTFAEAWIVGFICMFYDFEAIMTALLLTVGLTASLQAYAIFTKTDFTIMSGLLWIAVGILMLTIVLGMIFSENSAAFYVITCLVLLVMGVFLIYDTQLITGQGKYAMSIDDYILAALVLYIDIVTIFVELLSLFGRRE